MTPSPPQCADRGRGTSWSTQIQIDIYGDYQLISYYFTHYWKLTTKYVGSQVYDLKAWVNVVQ